MTAQTDVDIRKFATDPPLIMSSDILLSEKFFIKNIKKNAKLYCV